MVAGSGITSVTFQNTTAAPITDQVCTFGHVFKQGDLPSAGAAVSLVGSIALPTQIDVKATHPDGSVRHAVLSTVVPSLDANVSASFNITPARAAASVPAVPADFRGLDSVVSITDSGVAYTASLAALLAAGYKTWLAGPIVSEWLVSGLLKNTGGAAHPSIGVRFAVRAYKGKAWGRIDVTLENTKAPHGGTAPIKHAVYDLIITVGGDQVLNERAIAHLPYTRTRKTFWWGGAEPTMHVRHDTAYAIATTALPNYDAALVGATAKVAEDSYVSILEGNRGTFKNGVACAYMPTTGGRADIGLIPGWDALYVLGMNPGMRSVCFSQADLMGAWGAHHRDPVTDQPISPIDYPRYSYPPLETFQVTGITATNPAVVTTDTAHRLAPGMEVMLREVAGTMGVNYSVFNVGTCTDTTFQLLTDLTGKVYGGGGKVQPENPNTYEESHPPAVGFVAYMFSGDHYHLEELQFYAATSANGQTTYGNQSRGQAWALRDRAHAAYLSPDDDRLKGHFRNALDIALADYNAKFVDNPAANKLGALVGGSAWSDPDSYGNVTRTWQDDFFTQSLGRIVELGFAEALPMFRYKAKYAVSRIMYCRMLACPYNIKLRDGQGSELFSTIQEAYAATYPRNFPAGGNDILAQVFDSAAMAAQAGPVNGENNMPENSMLGYADSATGYVANMQPALALAATLGYPGADAAWTRFMARSVKPDYSGAPQFAIVPLKLTAGENPPAVPAPPIAKPGKIKGPSNKKLARMSKLQVTVFDPTTLGVVKIFGFVAASATGIVIVSDNAVSAGKQYALKVEDEKGIVLDIMFPLTAAT